MYIIIISLYSFCLSQHSIKHLLVIFCFLLDCKRISPAATWHPVESKRASLESKFHVASHLRCFRDTIMFRENLGSQLSCCQHCLALRQSPQHTVQVGRLYYLQVFVGSRILSANHLLRRIKDSHFLFFQESLDGIQSILLLFHIHEMELVSKEDDAEDTPHIILKIRIVPRHAPTLGRRRESAQHQQMRIRWQPGVKRMILYLHLFSSKKIPHFSPFTYFASLTRYITTGKWSLKPLSHLPPACVRRGAPLY